MSEESESHVEHIDPKERYKRKKQIEKDLSTIGNVSKQSDIAIRVSKECDIFYYGWLNK